ncbi:MAG: hypothetical protein R3C68_18795 [Myxococcota bacterium]
MLFGLGAVKGLGDAAIDAILDARAKDTFGSLYGFCEKVDAKKFNRKVLEVLIKSGAMDGFRAASLATSWRVRKCPRSGIACPERSTQWSDQLVCQFRHAGRHDSSRGE